MDTTCDSKSNSLECSERIRLRKLFLILFLYCFQNACHKYRKPFQMLYVNIARISGNETLELTKRPFHMNFYRLIILQIFIKFTQNLQKIVDFVIESIVFCPLVPPCWISLVDPTSARYTSAIYISYIYVWNGFPANVRFSIIRKLKTKYQVNSSKDSSNHNTNELVSTQNDSSDDARPKIWIRIPFLGKQGEFLVKIF